MRKLALASCLCFVLVAGAAAAQDLSPSQPGLEQPSAIRTATVIERRSLPPQMRVQVDGAIAQTSPDDLRQLRQAIETIPAATRALHARGMNAEAVIAVAVDEDGDLTLIAEESI